MTYAVMSVSVKGREMWQEDISTLFEAEEHAKECFQVMSAWCVTRVWIGEFDRGRLIRNIQYK